MKAKILIILLSIGFIFAACQKDDEADLKVEKEELKVSKRFLELKQGFSLARNIIGQNSSKIGTSAGTLKSGTLKSVKTDGMDDMDDMDDMDSFSDNFETCAKITESTDSEGNEVVTIDYGTEGCEDYGMLTKGKIITTFYAQADSTAPEKIKEEYVDFSFSFKYCADMDSLGNCAGEEKEETITMNGTVISEATYSGEWDGTFYFEEDLVYKYSDGEVVTSKATYKELYTEDSYTIIQGDGLYKGADFEYSYEVVEPVITKFSCGEDVFMPVSGIEKDSYKGKDENGNDESFDYEINYGKGECDNKATITENGVTKEVDFSDYTDTDSNDDYDDDMDMNS